MFLLSTDFIGSKVLVYNGFTYLIFVICLFNVKTICHIDKTF